MDENVKYLTSITMACANGDSPTYSHTQDLSEHSDEIGSK
jgi:hypothetical protein